MKYKILTVLALSIPLTTFADYNDLSASHHPIYMGVETGYGSTTWGYLVAPDENAALSFTTPIAVSEGGTIWGLLLGYEFSPNFGLEGSYTHYPNAKIHFDESSMFAYDNDDLTEFTTETETVSIIGKFMLYIPKTQIRAVSSFGIANIHREDMVYENWTLSPKFGVGLNYNLNTHLMVEVGINYTAGYAVTELEPTDDFTPFLYSGYLHLNWRV